MANNMERYIFSVDADTEKAVASLNEISKLMNQIDNIRNKGVDNYFTTSQKDMDKNMRSMSKLTQQYKELDRQLKEIQQTMNGRASNLTVPKGAGAEQVREIENMKAAANEAATAAQRQQQVLQKEYSKSLTSFRELATYQQNYSKNFKHVFNSNDLFNMPEGDVNRAKKIMEEMSKEIDPVVSKLDNVKSKINEVQKLDRRSESLSRRAEASNYMSYQQAASFNKDTRTVRQEYANERSENISSMAHLGQERTSLSEQIKSIESNESASQQDIDRKIALQQMVESIDTELEARIELNRVLDRTTRNMENYNDRVTRDGGVEVKPERGTMAGMMYERAPAIGLAAGGAFAGVFGGLYSKGQSLNEGVRDDTIAIGQMTETAGEDWRGTIRDGAIDAGLSDRLGFSAQEMLQFQSNYLTGEGYNGMDDLNSAMKNQAVFSRTTGVDANTTTDFFNTAFSSGAVSGDQVKDIQDAFIGAIKTSGMEGREKDQLKALQGLLQGVSQGRTMSNQEVMNVMGLQSVLANSGVRSLSGSQGGQLMSDMNEGIRGGFDDPSMRLMFGQGTKYQGLEGRFALREQMDKGISDITNVQALTGAALGTTTSENGQNEAFASAVDALGVDITAEQAKGIMDLQRQGKLTQETLNRTLENNKETGAETGDKKLEQYQGSKEALANQSETTTEKQSMQLNDFGDALRVANNAVGGIPAPFYAATLAAAALAASLGGAAISMRGSEWLRGRMSGNYTGKGGQGTKRGGLFGRKGKGGGSGGGGGIGGWFSGGSASKGLPGGGKSKGWLGDAGETVKGWFGGKGKGGGPKGGSAGIMAGGALGGGGGMLGKVLGKAALPLSILSGVGTVMSAPEGKTGSAVGEAAGGILGGVGGGALAGAAVGSVVPGVGTAIGGVVGGIGGGLAGSGIGKWIGGLFDGDKEADAEKDSKAEDKSLEKQVDRENTNTKDRAENKKGDNISGERDNLNTYDRLLSKAESLLNQARMQNGIFGSEASGSATGSVAATPLSGSGSEEQIWNFFADKGFSSSAIAGVMGNLQQESGLDPTAVNPTSGAFGIGQWLGGRKTNLKNYAKETGGDMNSLETQLNFLWKELNGGESTTKSILDKNGGLDALKNASTSKATELFEKAFERSGGDAMGKRHDYASNFYDKYANKSQHTRTASSSVMRGGNSRVDSTITVNVKGDEKVSDKMKDSHDLRKAASNIQSQIYSGLNYQTMEWGRS
jgi:Phage tail lysozyme